MGKLNVVILWHMHQPIYRDPWSGISSMPWVRLHASKSYNDMAAAIEKHDAKVVVNFSSSLLAQLKLLSSGATDLYFDIASKPTDVLSEEERAFVLDNFFSVNSETMIKPYPRYRELWEKRRRDGWRRGSEIQDNFTNGELRDLIVWFHLSWTGWAAREQYREISEIIERGWDFTESEKSLVMNIGLDVAKNVLERWKILYRLGRIEITASPYAHPILPLLIDTEIAHRAMPNAPLPPPFRYPEDAREQVIMSREVHKEIFGSYPCGMWPSEGSVAPEIIPILADAGYKWFATDEGVLMRSLNTEQRGQINLHPYKVVHNDKSAVGLFRDRYFSDLIGFDYCKIPEVDAAADLLRRVHDIAVTTLGWEDPALLTIALDGENAWESYREGGEAFFSALYKGFTEMNNVRTVLPCEWLESHPPKRTIQNIHSGSWIHANYGIWIGDQEENEAWKALLDTRRDYADMIASVKKPPNMQGTGLLGFFSSLLANIALIMAKEELFAAEGSDWFWWYGDDFTSDKDEEFDRIFRVHLANVYRFLGASPPDGLAEPILRPHPVKPDQEPISFIHPTIDGKVTEFYEWSDGGLYTVKAVGGAMYAREVYLEKIYYGFDEHRWYLRLDRREKAWDVSDTSNDKHVLIPDTIVIEFKAWKEPSVRIEIPARSAPDLPCRIFLPDRNHSELLTPLAKVAADDCMEISLPFKSLGVAPGTELQFTILLERAGKEIDRYPPAGFFKFDAPYPYFERKMWSA